MNIWLCEMSLSLSQIDDKCDKLLLILFVCSLQQFVRFLLYASTVESWESNISTFVCVDRCLYFE